MFCGFWVAKKWVRICEIQREKGDSWSRRNERSAINIIPGN